MHVCDVVCVRAVLEMHRVAAGWVVASMTADIRPFSAVQEVGVAMRLDDLARFLRKREVAVAVAIDVTCPRPALIACSSRDATREPFRCGDLWVSHSSIIYHHSCTVAVTTHCTFVVDESVSILIPRRVEMLIRIGSGGVQISEPTAFRPIW